MSGSELGTGESMNCRRCQVKVARSAEQDRLQMPPLCSPCRDKEIRDEEDFIIWQEVNTPHHGDCLCERCDG